MQKFSFAPGVQFNFEGGRLSSDSGLLLVHEFCERLGVRELLKELFPETREGSFKHSKSDILYQELIRIIAGYPSNNAANFLKQDPVFQEIHKSGSGIASSATCCRLEKTFNLVDLQNFRVLQKEIRKRSYELEKPESVVLDLDTTYDPASSSLEGANYNTHYKETGFSPLVCTEANTGDMIKADLRPGNTHCSKNVVPFLAPLLKEYQSLNILVHSRMDSAFASPEIFEVHEEYDAKYTIRLRRNAVLQREADRFFREFVTDEEKQTRRTVFFEIQYKAMSWKKARRVIIRLHWEQGKLFPAYTPFVTNSEEYDMRKCVEFYQGRAKAERDIDESKNGFSSDHLSAHSFISNRVRYQLFILAHLLVNFFRRFTFPKEQRNWTIQTIRQCLTKIASRAVKNSRTILFKLASGCPFQDLFLKIFKSTQALPRFG